MNTRDSVLPASEAETAVERPASPGEFLGVPEVAALMGCSPQTLYNLRRARKGPPSFRLGGKLRFRRSALDAWVAEAEALEAAVEAH